MVFSSLTYLFLFFAAVFLLYYVCNNRIYRNTLLLAASLLFYSWGEPRLVVLMLAASFAAYAGGILIHCLDRRQKKGLKKLVFVLTVIVIAANLFVFKYLNFVFDNINALFGADIQIPEIVLPIGISFYTFQILSYVIDLYKNQVAVQKNYFYLTLYVSFFPQLIAGPIVRYKTIEHDIRHRTETIYDVSEGLKRFIAGLAKKVIIANNAARIAEIIYAGDKDIYGSFMYWVAAFAYTLQIYFDFSGYSDMAIGLGRMFGFRFLENFNYPYISLSVTDFWRRWHISLSSWFRDYIYIPLGGNRVKPARHIFNILAVWTLTGIWHGASWNFLLWGLYYGVLLIAEKYIWGRALEKIPKLCRWMYSMFFVVIGWVIFNFTDGAEILSALGMMFSFRPTDFLHAVAADTDIFTALVYLPLGILFMLPLFKRKEKKGPFMLLGENIVYFALLAVCVVYIVSSSYNPFIYFRF